MNISNKAMLFEVRIADKMRWRKIENRFSNIIVLYLILNCNNKFELFKVSVKVLCFYALNSFV